jgi:hypothetical protein
MAPASYATQSFLESLAEPDRAALLRLGHRRHWQRGDVLVHAGDRADSDTRASGFSYCTRVTDRSIDFQAHDTPGDAQPCRND